MDDNYKVSHEGFAGPTGLSIEVVPQLNLIVLDKEELEKMLYFFFKEGESLGSEAERKNAFAALQSPDFKTTLTTYLTSKGIQL